MNRQEINLEAYTLNKSQYIKSIESYVYILEHNKTKAKVMVISNDDPNKVFSISFRTPPYNSTGLPHILEHSVLCGSRKFPVKDPFLELLKSSLQTFLNAFTAPDTTTYPCASCNKKDFENLMDVYLDATFYPNIYLHEEIFKQEGWHYELESKDSDITINGVVYNEMKGAFSNVDNIIWNKVLESLFPNTCYSVNSGGDPDVIPTLTYEQFKAFHKKYYHPSNSYIVLYGDIDIEERLNFMDKEYLSNFDYLKVDSEIKTQEAFNDINELNDIYPIAQNVSEKNKAMFSYNICLGGLDDPILSCSHSIISYCLFNAPGAPLKEKLTKAKIAQSIFGEYEPSLKQPIFMIVCQNCNENKLNKFRELVEEGLYEASINGIDEQMLLSTINNFDFRDREKDFGSYPKGLAYAMDAVNNWIYGLDPTMRLSSDGIFDTLRSYINTDYYKNIIKKYYVENKHKSIVCLNASNKIAKQKDEAFKESLRKFKESLSESEIEKIIDDTLALKAYQQTPSTPEEYATLPKLSREDINLDVRPYSLEEHNIDGLKVLHSNYHTNDINYVNLLFEITNIQNDMVCYIGLLTSLLIELSTSTYSYKDLNTELNIATGAVKISPVSYETYDPLNKRFFVEVSFKCLDTFTSKALELIMDILTNTNFNDYERIYEILQEQYSVNVQALVSSGHVYASSKAESYFDKNSYFGDLIGGIKYNDFLNDLFKNYEDKKVETSTVLENLCKNIFKTSNLIIHLTSSTDSFNLFSDKIKKIKEIDNVSLDTIKYNFNYNQELLNEGFKSSSKVQYVAKAGFTPTKMKAGSLKVLQKILSTEYLWMKVRVDGGAYGCMLDLSENGRGYFVSYRDPNLKRTLEVYDEIPNFIENLECDEEKLTNFIIGTIASMDKPLSPRQLGSRSLSSYFTKYTIDYLKKVRNDVVNCTIEDIKLLAKPIKEILDCNAICVIGNEDVIEENKDIFNTISNL